MTPGGHLDAVMSVNKPVGPTSFDMVWLVRKALEEKKVGHCGTLDPFATGLLLICTGRATRIADLLMKRPKIYRAGLILGVTTTTGDPTGEVTAVSDASGVTAEDLGRCLLDFTGEIMQKPHCFSAVKKDGRRLYSLARAGLEAEADERLVTISRLEILSVDAPGEDNSVRAVIEVECSSGTYIRSLAEDIGKALGSGGSLYSLERTRIGGFGLDRAIRIPPPGLSGRYGAGGAADLARELTASGTPIFGETVPVAAESIGPFITMSAALDWLPRAVCNESGTRVVGNGGPLTACCLKVYPHCGQGETIVVCDSSGAMLALHIWSGSGSEISGTPGEISGTPGEISGTGVLADPGARLSRPIKVLVG